MRKHVALDPLVAPLQEPILRVCGFLQHVCQRRPHSPQCRCSTTALLEPGADLLHACPLRLGRLGRHAVAATRGSHGVASRWGHYGRPRHRRCHWRWLKHLHLLHGPWWGADFPGNDLRNGSVPRRIKVGARAAQLHKGLHLLCRGQLRRGRRRFGHGQGGDQRTARAVEQTRACLPQHPVASVTCNALSRLHGHHPTTLFRGLAGSPTQVDDGAYAQRSQDSLRPWLLGAAVCPQVQGRWPPPSPGRV
mmetsp:Transcript_22378/g.47795  ORF Transcript_22378/g.47795 Transcript_22378/m.47795 type:complete len:249 (+) Transcript_22378:184-930(+)